MIQKVDPKAKKTSLATMPELAPTANGGVVRIPDAEPSRDPVDQRTTSERAAGSARTPPRAAAKLS